MTDKAAYTVGDSAAGGEGPAAVYPSFKATEDSAHGVGRLQALDERGVAKGNIVRGRSCAHVAQTLHTASHNLQARLRTSLHPAPKM